MTLKDIERIYVISLLNSERKQDVKHELNKNFIWFNWYDAIENKEDGAKGLKDTFKKLFSECLEKGYQNVAVFEDDAVFTDGANYSDIAIVLNDLPEDYHICKFGANLLFPVSAVTENINRILMSYALHACVYSKAGMELILKFIDSSEEPIDVIIAQNIETLGHCYISSKMIMTQRPYKSNIFKYNPLIHSRLGKLYETDKGIIRWDLMMEERWKANTKHLKTIV